MRHWMNSDPGAPAAARRLAEAALAGADLCPVVLRHVKLLVSELITNAMQHGRPPIEFSLNFDEQCISVEVTDFGESMPVHPQSGGDPTRGRGLLIVSKIASQWGTRRHQVGKTVWCDISFGPSPV